MHVRKYVNLSVFAAVSLSSQEAASALAEATASLAPQRIQTLSSLVAAQP